MRALICRRWGHKPKPVMARTVVAAPHEGTTLVWVREVCIGIVCRRCRGRLL